MILILFFLNYCFPTWLLYIFYFLVSFFFLLSPPILSRCFGKSRTVSGSHPIFHILFELFFSAPPPTHYVPAPLVSFNPIEFRVGHGSGDDDEDARETERKKKNAWKVDKKWLDRTIKRGEKEMRKKSVDAWRRSEEWGRFLERSLAVPVQWRYVGPMSAPGTDPPGATAAALQKKIARAHFDACKNENETKKQDKETKPNSLVRHIFRFTSCDFVSNRLSLRWRRNVVQPRCWKRRKITHTAKNMSSLYVYHLWVKIQQPIAFFSRKKTNRFFFFGFQGDRELTRSFHCIQDNLAIKYKLQYHQ